jgi:hypothetical protein
MRNWNEITDFIESFPIWAAFVLLWMGAYSITRLVVTDDFYVFSKPREWIKKNFPPEGEVVSSVPKHRKPTQFKRLPNNKDYVILEGHWLGELISCPWCSGFWISLALWTAFLFMPTVVLIGIAPLAMRAFVGFFAGIVGG